MQLAVYSHNKFAHLGVVRYGRLLSLQTNLSVAEILSLPQPERDYLDGQSGKYLNAPLGLYPLLPPPEESSRAINDDELSLAVRYGSGAVIPLPSESTICTAEISVREFLTESGATAGYCIEVIWRSSEPTAKPFAVSLGPWVTTVSELGEPSSPQGHSFEISATVNGQPSQLGSIKSGDVVLVEVPGLGTLQNTLAG